MFVYFFEYYIDFISSHDIILFLFFNIIIANSIFIFFMKNPVYSLILLMLNYSLVSFIFIFNGVIFLGLVFMLVYVGAISILLVFTLMLLNLRIIYFKSSNIKNFYNMFYAIYLFEILFFVYLHNSTNIYYYDDYIFVDWFEIVTLKTDLVALSYDLFLANIDIVLFISIYLTFILVATTSIVSIFVDTKKQKNFLQIKIHNKKLIN